MECCDDYLTVARAAVFQAGTLVAMADGIRSGSLHDLERLQEIEKAAGLAFREIGMHAIAKDEPVPIEVLADYQRRGHCGQERPLPGSSASAVPALYTGNG